MALAHGAWMRHTVRPRPQANGAVMMTKATSP